MRLIITFMIGVCFVYAKHEIYDGHSLLKIKIQNEAQQNFLYSLADPLLLDMWVLPVPGRDAEVLVSKQFNQQLQTELYENGFEFEIQTDNIKRSLDLEDKLFEAATRKNVAKSSSGRIGFDRVYNWTEVDAYLDSIAESYPDVVTLVKAGKSFEGKDIKYLKISKTNFQDTSKPIVFIQSLLHAREWITLPPTLWAIEQLVVNVTEPDLIDSMDWIILPIANPDGYEHTYLGNRFWRKNRSTGHIINDICVGVDLNRNFDIKWGGTSSSFACSDQYHGKSPGSEPETAIIAKILEEHKNRIDLFIDIHSYGSYIVYGWGDGVLLPNAFSLQQVGLNMARAIDAVKVDFNKNYTVGNAGLVLYPASGLAMDYVNKVGIPYSYIYELPRRRFGISLFGFLVDPDLVEQFAMETWEGIKIGARNVRDIFG